jgi:hypothetical protein
MCLSSAFNGDSNRIDACSCHMQVLKDGTFGSVMAHVGHDGGKLEYRAIRRMMRAAPTDSFVCSEASLLNRLAAPRLLLVWKRTRTEQPRN